jgi:hypothetical protein
MLGIHETIFPLIANIIANRDSEKFISQRELSQQLLQDNRSTIEAAYKIKSRKMTIERYAVDMVSWFSACWTEEDPKWSQLFAKFERNEIDGCYAYRKRA